MASGTTPVAPVRLTVGLLGLSNGSAATVVIAKIELVRCVGQIGAASGRVVNFVVAVRLRILVNDEIGHFTTLPSW